MMTDPCAFKVSFATNPAADAFRYYPSTTKPDPINSFIVKIK